MVGMLLLAYMNLNNAGFTEGRSLEFTHAIEKRYRESGVEIHSRSQVDHILVENNQAIIEDSIHG
jgi:phytoene dehydrogenase-like protein